MDWQRVCTVAPEAILLLGGVLYLFSLFCLVLLHVDV